MEIYDRGRRLKALRKKRGLSQKAVADRLGVDRAAISAYAVSYTHLDVYKRQVFTPSCFQ